MTAVLIGAAYLVGATALAVVIGRSMAAADRAATPPARPQLRLVHTSPPAARVGEAPRRRGHHTTA